MKLFKEFDKHLMEDEKPSIYFNEESKKLYFKEYPLNLLTKLKDTEQSIKYHPEGNVWNHTMLVVDEAASRRSLSGDKNSFMWAALLHDIGKADTTKIRKGKITSYDHDKLGEQLSMYFLMEFTKDENFINKVSKLVRWHMQPFHVIKNPRFAEVEEMIIDVPIEELALLSLCDRLGRGGMTKEKIQEESLAIKSFLKKVKPNQHTKILQSLRTL